MQALLVDLGCLGVIAPGPGPADVGPVAQIYGKGEEEGAGKILSLALILAAAFGIRLILLIGPTSNWLAGLLGAAGEVQINAVKYMQIRLFGAPAVLITLVTFGALRGLQDM